MSDETPGAGQTTLPPREGLPSVRLGGGQYYLTTQQSPAVPTYAQLSSSGVVQQQLGSVQQQTGVTRIISISPSKAGQTSPLRPSLTNQSIVHALTKSRPANVRLHLIPMIDSVGSAQPPQVSSRSPLKRSFQPSSDRKDTYAVKLQRVMNHRNVRSKIVKEKYSEHLFESFHLSSGANILELYHHTKRPKTQQFMAYLKENAIEYATEDVHSVVQTVQPTPTATAVSSLPGMSSNTSTSTVTHPIIASTAHATDTQTHKANTNTNRNKAALTTTPPAPPNNQEQIVEKAKQEAHVVQRISDLQKEGLWSEKRLPKVQEMPRVKAHWDFLLEEMVWLAADFAQERKWKKAAAKKCARMVQKYFQDKALAAQRAEKAHEQHIRRVAAFCAKEIRTFWSNVEKLVEYKQNTRLEEKRKKALDQHLSFIVDQTEKYSQLLAEGMNKPINVDQTPDDSKANSDDEFHPEENSSDDEETIAQEEAVDTTEKTEEVAALQRESEMNFEDFLSELPKDYLQNRDKIRLRDSDDSDENDDKSDLSSKGKPKSPKDDEDFRADSNSEDDEDTIQEQEKAEGDQNHKEELDDLNAEAEMDIEELRKKYANAPPDEENSNLTASTMDSKSSSETDETSGDEDDSESDQSKHSEEKMDISEEDVDIGLKSLLDDSKGDDTKTDNNDLINDAAAIAESIQPKGNTLSSTSVVTPVPFLLKFPLREYQHIGLDWLVTMFERKLNGILADEMGLGKTIQTIALLAHLACVKENWGPHLIIVPTSVMLNWEMECKKWCPGFKILTYYGSQKERKLKRTGWTKPNAFHICITSYKLVIQDHQSFRRKKWKYLILDEAQNIKNFKSQRWQLLLNFQTQQRLLLTGTPLQNNLMELWSLMHFLMPNVFQSHREFKEWFSNPVTGMIEGNSEYNENIIKRLHKVLRPFLLRRLKSEVEKQMPKKYEHVVMCRLSKRQRYLYDDYMSRAKTRETLASGNLLSVINVLMQLRKVCNHPNLFEHRPTVSPFYCEGIVMHIPSIVYTALEPSIWKNVDLISMNMNLAYIELYYSAYQCYRLRQYRATRKYITTIESESDVPHCPPSRLTLKVQKPAMKQVKTELKEERAQVTATAQGRKLKLVHHEGGILKAFPVAGTSTTTQNQSTLSLSSVLKPSVPGYAQLVQTSTGKHILLTPTCNINTQSMGISGTTTVMTPSGQKLTVLSKQPVATTNTTPSAIAKAVVKVQLTSLPTAGQPMPSGEVKQEERKVVGAKYIDKLYLQSPKKPLDVRWQQNSEVEKVEEVKTDFVEDAEDARRAKLDLLARVNELRCSPVPVYGKDFVEEMQMISLETKNRWGSGMSHCLNSAQGKEISKTTDCLKEIVYTPVRRIEDMSDIFNRFIVCVPEAHAPRPEIRVWNPPPSIYWGRQREQRKLAHTLMEATTPLHEVASAMVTQFPHPRLIQYDCGKLQTMDILLRKLKRGGHRVLIFTQMTKMLDVLEAFLNFHGHIYLRLDGSTKIDQRQILMERFNGDKRIFAFILSTRSGGVGVNLTGADTVIFYDSDWNPTMDAQAQDRCHRIGQTRDVHIYRLVSEKTIEENILKKANQKRLLGDLAIEGGNFTTAYFKSTTIQDLFSIDATEDSAANRMSEVVEISRERDRRTDEEPAVPAEEKSAMGALENALAACEDDQDVIAARTAKAEAVADLAEFDENIPLEDPDREKEPEISKAEMEVENLVKQLTPVERYAMRFIEETEAAWSKEQLAAAEREIEEKKREWEENRLAAMREEELRRAKEMEEENELLTFSREDADNQIWVSDNTGEQMPMWCPPTPPQQDGDMYIDQTMPFLYETSVMTEQQLPPVYVKKEPKRSRHEAGLIESRRALKMHRKEDMVYPPRSLFERTSPGLKMRRDQKLQKFRSGMVRPQIPVKFPLAKPAIEPPCLHNWTIHEDMALLKVVQNYQAFMAMNIVMTNSGPNWDFVSDYVNTVSITFRSPKQCRYRYETILVPREEGKQIIDTSPRKKKQKTNMYKFPVPTKSSRPMRTAQLYAQDNNASFSQLMAQRFDDLKGITVKKPVLTKPAIMSTPLLKNPKHASILNEANIDMDHPMMPVEVATRRAERVAREKKTMTPEQQLAVAHKLQLLRAAQANSNIINASAGSSNVVQQQIIASNTQVTVVQAAPVSTVTTTIVAAPSTPTNTLRTQRIIASPLQNTTVVSVSGISPAQLQAQRLIVSGTPGQTKTTVVGTAGTVQGKTISQAQFHMIRQAAALNKPHLRLQTGGIATPGVKTTVSIAGQTAVQVAFTQAQPRTQYVKQGTVAITGKQGFTRTVTETEMAQLLKRQQQLQQAKVLAAATASASGSQSTTMHNISPQVFAQAIQAGSSGTQVATLVKAVSSSGVPQTVIGTPVKTIPQGIKTSPQLRALQIQQQFLAQKKISQKITGIAQVTGKGGVATQLIVGPKPMSTATAMGMQQLQVIRSPMPQGPVVLAKAPSRIIPVNTSQGTKPTIQVVAATSQGITTTIRPQTTSTLAGALAGIKVQGGSQAQQALLSAAFGQHMRQNSPVRIQTTGGTPVVSVAMPSGTTSIQQQHHHQQHQQQQAQQQQGIDKSDHVSRFIKK